MKPFELNSALKWNEPLALSIAEVTRTVCFFWNVMKLKVLRAAFLRNAMAFLISSTSLRSASPKMFSIDAVKFTLEGSSV
ncbi:hypothetical protein D3C73_1536780 [compost metagenome]